MGHQIIAEGLPILRLSEFGGPCPDGLEPISGTHPAGYYDPPHSHDRAQFSFRTQGLALVKADNRSFLLPPGYGVWIPRGVVHEVACRGPAAYYGFYAEPGIAPQPAGVRVIRVSPLLRALADSPLDRDHSGGDPRRNLICRLMLEEIVRAPDVRADAPTMPASPRLQAVCEQLRGAPENAESVDIWASRAGMSRRSFTRAFRAETGMSFAEWRHKVRLLRAIAWRAEGVTLHEVANRLGYGSLSSFNRAFGPAVRLLVQ